MSRKLLIALFVIIAVISIWVSRKVNHIDDIGRDFKSPFWLFNFGPENGPNFLNFKKVSSRSVYSSAAGFGWLKLEGSVKKGKWPAASAIWESTDNLNAILRPGPDDLSSSYITGTAIFILDVDPGKYDVWILTGDSGLYEYVPYQAYRIEVNGEEAYQLNKNEAEFYKTLTSLANDDILNEKDIYNHYIEPLYHWQKTTVDARDGKIKVRVLSQKRDRSLLGLLGDYPHSEQRSGPVSRYGGALNAMIVARSGTDTINLVKQVEKRRRKNFLSKLPKRKVPLDKANIKTADRLRGYHIFVPEIGEKVFPGTDRSSKQKSIKAIATPGEYIPLTLAIVPYHDLGATQVVFDTLTGTDAAHTGLRDIKLGVVRYVADPVDYRKKSPWQPVPGPIVPLKNLVIKDNVTKQIWITTHVPDNAVPGMYTGKIQIIPSQSKPLDIPVTLQVLPFTLKRPTDLSTGLTYFVPIMDAYFGKDRFWNRIRQEFADMRRHNMTSVQLTGMGLENYEGLDKLFSAYKDAGFEQPVYFLESAARINQVKTKPEFTVNSREFNKFCDKYIRTISNFWAEKTRRHWPDVIIDFGDEFTNIAKEDVGAEIAKRLEKIPGIVTGADVDGNKELRLLGTHVNVLSFNAGWAGPTGVNKGTRQLVHGQTVKDILQMGASPWLVNIGKDRFSNGYYYWKLSKLGLKGKMEWIYRDYRAMPNNPFDGRGSHANKLDTAIYRGPDNSILPTIPYERMRQGLDDLAYLSTLEDFTRKVPSSDVKSEAQALLNRINQMIDSDFSHYENPNSDAYRWTNSRYYQLRSEISNMIIKLKNNSK